jgi:ElaB/YqjD/DUF883 family membrane-anchored ribosome-binding protein
MATSPYLEDPLERRGSTIEPATRVTGAPTTERTVAAAHRSVDAFGVRASRSEQTLRSAIDSSANKYLQTRNYVNHQVDYARSYVRQHPLVAAGAAFAAGALLTSLLGKRR